MIEWANRSDREGLAGMSEFVKIKNWEQFQHYKQRNPPWIKLHRQILNDPDWWELDDLSARILMCLWLLASEGENNGRVNVESDVLAWRLRLDSTMLAKPLQVLTEKGFIQHASKTLASCKQSARQRREEKRREDIDNVLSHYHQSHPLRKIGDEKQRRLISKALELGFSVVDLKMAITGNAQDPWHKEKRKHELSYVLRDVDHINNFVSKYQQNEEPIDPEFLP